MRRSNRNFNIPSPLGIPQAFDYSLCSGNGNLTGRAFPGWGTWPLSGWVGENWNGSVSNVFFFLAPKALAAVNTCLDEMKELKEEIQQLAEWLFFFPFSNWTVKRVWLRNSSLSYYRVKRIWYVFTPPPPPISVLTLYASVRGNEPTLNNWKYIQS